MRNVYRAIYLGSAALTAIVLAGIGLFQFHEREGWVYSAFISNERTSRREPAQ